MPNWCEGHLRIKGSLEDVTRFLKENIVGFTYSKTNFADGPIEVELEDSGSSLQLPEGGWLYFKDSRRLFPVDDVVYYPDWYEDEPIYIMRIQQAWGLDSDWFQIKSKDYNLHMKIDGYEAGMQFAQFIEVDCGVLLKNETVEYDEWYWDCPCPLLGG